MSTERVNNGKGTILFGGSGFLGPYILERCPEMISVGRSPPPTNNRHIRIPSLDDLSPLRGVEFDKVIYIIGNTDHYNLAKDRLDPGKPSAWDYHVIPLIKAMEQLKHYPIRRMLHFSSILVYDDKRLTMPVSEHAPIDPYKNRYVMSKYLAEELCKFFAQWIPNLNIRFCNLYGPTPLSRYDLIHVLARKLVTEGRAQAWSDKPERDFIYVEDAADAIVKLLECDHAGTVNLGTGTLTPVRRVLDVLRQVSGCPIDVLDKPVSGPARFQADTTTLRRIIDWTPKVPVEEGVRRCYEMAKRVWGPGR